MAGVAMKQQASSRRTSPIRAPWILPPRGCQRTRPILDPKAAHCAPSGLTFDRGVHLVDQLEPIGQLEVLGQVTLGVVARLAVQGHVERDQTGSVEVGATSGDLVLERRLQRSRRLLWLRLLWLGVGAQGG